MIFLPLCLEAYCCRNTKEPLCGEFVFLINSDEVAEHIISARDLEKPELVLVVNEDDLDEFLYQVVYTAVRLKTTFKKLDYDYEWRANQYGLEVVVDNYRSAIVSRKPHWLLLTQWRGLCVTIVLFQFNLSRLEVDAVTIDLATRR